MRRAPSASVGLKPLTLPFTLSLDIAVLPDVLKRVSIISVFPWVLVVAGIVVFSLVMIQLCIAIATATRIFPTGVFGVNARSPYILVIRPLS